MNPDSDIYTAAVRLFEQEYFDESLRLTDYGLQACPDNGQLWELKGLIHRIQQDADACLHALRQADERIRLRPVAICAMADCLAHSGETRIARQLYLSVFDDPLAPAEILRGVVEGFAYIGEWGLCVTVCREWCHDRPDDARARFQLAFALENSDAEVDEISAVCNDAVRLSCDRLNYRISFALLMYHRREFDKAYQFVAALTKYDLALAGGGGGCCCALRHLRNVYHAVGDLARRDWCAEIIASGDQFC